MVHDLRLTFLASIAAALVLGRAAGGCATSTTSGDTSSEGGSSSASSSSTSGAGGATSSSSSGSTSSSSGASCLRCNAVEKGGDPSMLCAGSKAVYDTLKMCKCGSMCSTECKMACTGMSTDSICLMCLDTKCHNEVAACLADQ